MRELNPKSKIQNPKYHGLSLVEVLISLAITAMLLVATMAATNACFKAYADAAEQFSTQAATRMVINRLMTLLRTSTAYGPLLADASFTPASTLTGDTITGAYLEMLDPNGKLVRIEWRQDAQELWLIQSNLDGTHKLAQPLIGGVTSATFSCQRRRNTLGQWTLQRATMDLSILPGADAVDAQGQRVLAIERGAFTPIRVVGSTKPRKLQDP